MKYKLLNVALAALLIPAANFASAEAKPAAMNISGNMVKIGVLTDMSGVYSDLGGQGAVTAVQMAIDDFKAHIGGPAHVVEFRAAIKDCAEKTTLRITQDAI